MDYEGKHKHLLPKVKSIDDLVDNLEQYIDEIEVDITDLKDELNLAHEKNEYLRICNLNLHNQNHEQRCDILDLEDELAFVKNENARLDKIVHENIYGKYVTELMGDLLDFPSGINIIAHCANCQNVMGAGIAAQIKRKYPQAFQVDSEYEGDKLGDLSIAIVSPDTYVVNLYGQERFGKGRQVNYEAIYTSLNQLFLFASSRENAVVGLPKFMGCGLAGGSWPIVYQMIKDRAENYKVKTIIVEYNK